MCTAADKAGKAKGQGKVKKGPKVRFGHIRVKHQIEMSGRHPNISLEFKGQIDQS